MSEIRKILENASPAGTSVSADFLPLVYDELRTLAVRQMSREGSGQTLQATALVHEAWLRLTEEEARLWSDRAHFFRAAALAMRRILVDRARAKATLKRGGNVETIDIHDLNLAEPTADERVLLVDEMLDRLEEENPEGARVVLLKFFGGLTEEEIATTDGVTERTVRRRWAYAKTRLFQMACEERDLQIPQ